MRDGKTYLIILIESSIETLPQQLISTSKAKSLSKRYRIPPQYLILDKSVFYQEMKKHGINKKRGRPDIIHQFLLATQYSPLNRKKKLRVLIHTINNELITISPETRIPKNYHQFLNLIQHLYIKKRIPEDKKPLLTLQKNKNMKEILREYGIEKLILLREKGEPKPFEWFATKTHPPHAIGVGGFPHGDFKKEVLNQAWKQVSLYSGESYDAWIITDRILCNLEKMVL